MKKVVLGIVFSLFISGKTYADCSWFNAADTNCYNNFEERAKSLKKNFPKVKNTSPYYKIYELTTNNNPPLCNLFLKNAEKFRTSTDQNPTLDTEILEFIGSDTWDEEIIKNDKLIFTKLAPNSYLATSITNTSLYTYYSKYKITNKVQKMQTDDFVRFPLNSQTIFSGSSDFDQDDDYSFYYNSKTKKYYVVGYDAMSWKNSFLGYIYELSTKDNQIKPICEYQLSVHNIMQPLQTQFSELIRLYKIIVGDKCCIFASNSTFHIDEHILDKGYFLILYPSKYSPRWSERTNNIWKFYENWADLSPINNMQYQKFLTELEKYGNYMGEILRKNLAIKDEAQLDTLKYILAKNILADISIIYNYDTYQKQPDNFIQKIQNNNISDKELTDNLKRQYEIQQLYGDAWFVEPALFHALPYPQLLKRMILAGYDINVPNWYSKTPLMTAAHLNSYEATEILLKAGADTEKRMGKLIRDDLFPHGEYPNYNINRKERTALMYACENADYNLIKLLIDYGADITAKDSQNNGMDYYINLNPRLSKSDKKDILKLLQNF